MEAWAEKLRQKYGIAWPVDETEPDIEEDNECH